MVKNPEDKWNEMLSEYLDQDGNDVTLLTGLDLRYFELYGKTRMELAKKYPKPERYRVDETDTVNIEDARDDSKAPLFIRALTACKEMFDRTSILQHMATEYEKKCVRFYANTTRAWHTASADLKKAFQDSDIYEMVESYFKILRKYGLNTKEEPYYFLAPKHKRRVIHEGEMLKRTTQIDENEIHVSLLEEFA